MKEQIKNYRLELAGIVAGAVGGFSWWYFVGCASGTCPITSHPLNMTLYGSFMGALLFSMFSKRKQVNTKNRNDESK